MEKGVYFFEFVCHKIAEFTAHDSSEECQKATDEHVWEDADGPSEVVVGG